MEENLVQQFPTNQKKFNLKEILLSVGIILAIIIAGGVTGYFLSNRGQGSAMVPAQSKKLIQIQN